MKAGKDWIGLLFRSDGSKIKNVVLLSDDERKIKQLKTDIEAHLKKLRGKAVDESSKCLDVVVDLEKISPGYCLLLFADAGAINNNTFTVFGLALEHKRKFSNLLASATHDERQYTSATRVTKKKKYHENVTRLDTKS